MHILLLIVIALTAVSKAQITSGVFFANVGGAGSYQQVVAQPDGSGATCGIATPCVRQTLNIPAHSLAPFDEEISLHFRGPLNMNRIAVYQPVQGQYQLVSNWQAGGASSNITFLNSVNCDTDVDVCQGPALGYANSQGSGCTSVPTDFSGFLDNSYELVVMSGVQCNGDCGEYRGVGYHAWSGEKIMVIETSMPHSGAAVDIPAVWALNAQIPRTGQYLCNCWPDCGEFDIAEVVTNGATEAYQTIYSYNGDRTNPGYFPRPVDSASTYVVHYSIADNRVYVINVPGGCFQYSQILKASYVAALHALTVDVNALTNDPNSNLVGTCPSAPPSGPGQVVTSAPATAAPTQASATTPSVPESPSTEPPATDVDTSGVANLCGLGCAACCSDIVLGPVCYDPTSYVCTSGKLCPSGTAACGTACYPPSVYKCVDGALELL